MSNPQPVQLATPHPSIRPPWQQRATQPEASSLLAARRFSSDASACEQPADCGSHRRSHGGATTDAIHPVVEISPPDIVSRRAITWHGMTAETVKTTKQVNVEYCFRAPMHLLVAYEEGERRSGETFVEGAPRSNLRNFARKLTFVPAGHEYREWHDPLTRSRRTHFYFDPAKLDSALGIADRSFAPRLFFEDATLWDTALKLKSLVNSAASEDQLYFDALGVVLVHELVRLYGGMSSIPAPAPGRARRVAGTGRRRLHRETSGGADTARHACAARPLEPVLFLPGLQTIVRNATASVPDPPPHGVRQAAAGKARGLGDGDWHNVRFQQHQLIYCRIPQGDWRHAHRLSPEHRLAAARKDRRAQGDG